MVNVKDEVIKMLNRGLELEYAARIQYLAHAEKIKGPGAEKIVERLKEIASDELNHEEKFRNLIAVYLDGDVSMSLAETHPSSDQKAIFEINLKIEKDAINFYKQIYQKVTENKKDFQYSFETLEHELRHIIIDEQEHVVELSLL